MSVWSTVAAVLAQQQPYATPAPWSYVIIGWGLIVAGIAAYAASLMVRGRRLSQQVPPEERRFLGDADRAEDQA